MIKRVWAHITNSYVNFLQHLRVAPTAHMRGFTIVELLIVIVIIGILAAIVIVAYNGITKKANDSAYKQDADSISKAIESFNAEAGAYPTTANLTVAASGSNPAYGNLTSSIVTLSTTMPANAQIMSVTAAPSAGTAVATTNCTTTLTPTWASCKTSASNTKYYAVWLKTTGACVYYTQTSDSTLKNTTAGAPGTC